MSDRVYKPTKSAAVVKSLTTITGVPAKFSEKIEPGVSCKKMLAGIVQIVHTVSIFPLGVTQPLML